MFYFKCNMCGCLFDNYDAHIKSENVTDNYYENYYVCPECGSSNIEEITEEEYDRLMEAEDND